MSNGDAQERRKFGPVGWNAQYDFSQADLECGMMNLAIFLLHSQGASIPWGAITHVIGGINYGGRVTNDFDRRTLEATAQQYLSPAVMQPDASFTSSGRYTVPEDGPLEVYRWGVSLASLGSGARATTTACGQFRNLICQLLPCTSVAFAYIWYKYPPLLSA